MKARNRVGGQPSSRRQLLILSYLTETSQTDTFTAIRVTSYTRLVFDLCSDLGYRVSNWLAVGIYIGTTYPGASCCSYSIMPELSWMATSSAQVPVCPLSFSVLRETLRIPLDSSTVLPTRHQRCSQFNQISLDPMTELTDIFNLKLNCWTD
jgi:hypothetical protein